MPPILIILNILVLAVGIVVFYAVSKRFRKLFILGAFIPLAILAIISFVSQPLTAVGPKEILFFLLRGGLLFSVFSGLLTCYLISRRSQSTRDDKGA